MGQSDQAEDARRDQFAAEVLDALLARPTVTGARYLPESFRIDYARAESDTPVQMYLANTFAECQGADDAERAARIAKLAAIADLPVRIEGWEQIRPLLRPVLRQATFAQGLDPVKAPLTRPALPYLAELVVIDTPVAMRFVTVPELGGWEKSAAEVFDAARANLLPTAQRMAQAEPADRPVLMRYVDDGDGYFSSLPLIPGWLADMAAPSGGRPLAFVAENFSLVVVGEPEDPGALARLIDLALEQYRQAVREITPVPYTVDGSGAVVPLTLPRDHPAWPALRRAETALAADVYSQQTTYLRAEYERDDVDVYVASLIQAQAGTGAAPFTVASWADGIVSSLPYAHYISLGPAEDPFFVPFDAVIAELGLTPTPGLHPPRYRVGPWPQGPALDRLREMAEQP